MTRPIGVRRSRHRYSTGEADGGLDGVWHPIQAGTRFGYTVCMHSPIPPRTEPQKSLIERAYKVRLKLTRSQQHTLQRLFGAARYVWNWAVETRSTAYRERGEKLNWVSLSKQFTALRTAPGTEWLSTLPREPFNQVLRDQEQAFTHFFAKRAHYPRFKGRGQHSSVRFTLDQRRTQVNRAAATVLLPGLGSVRFKQTYGAMPGRLRSVTLSRDAGGRYFASFTADNIEAPVFTEPAQPSVGIDLGLNIWATPSSGEAIAAPKALAQKQKRLRRYQRSMSRKRDAALRTLGLDPNKPIPKGTRIPQSKRSLRMKRRIGRLHSRIRDTRVNALHRFTSGIVRRIGLIGIEDLSVKGMVRGMGRRAFRRSVSDAALGELRRQLEYKARWYGRVVIPIDRFYPSSKRCFECGAVHVDLKLSDRHWQCPACHAELDRDLNAAKNIEAEALRLHAETTARNAGGDARGADKGRTAEIVPLFQPSVMNREPVTRRAAPSSRTRRRERRGTGT